MPLVFLDKFVAGYPATDDARAASATAGEILNYRYSTDAHFVAYHADVERRHTTAICHDPELAARVNVRMTLAIFDVDGPDHICTPEWMAGECDKLAALLDAHPGAFVYTTRGGYRVVFALPSPHPIRCQADADRWTAGYRSWIRYLKRRFDIRADVACADWGRLYRLPFVVRDGVVQEPDTFGDPSALGVWVPALTKRDTVEPRTIEHAVHARVEAVPIADPSSEYGQARLARAVRYLQIAPLSIRGESGRNVMFGICAYLTRTLRLPVDLAADCIEQIYNPRLIEAGTTAWSRDTPGAHGMSIVERLEKARDGSKIPPGAIIDEATWAAFFGDLT